MLAAIYDGQTIVLRNDIKIPRIRDNEVLIQVKAVGICGTDLSILKGTYRIPVPRILGHELSGIVSEIGKKVTMAKLGDRVTSEINISCGNCHFCKSNQKSQCTSVRAIGIYEDGAFANYLKVPETNLHQIHNLSFEEATFIEPLAAAIQTFEMAPLRESDKTIVIIGAGKLGLLLLQVVKNQGRKAIVIGRSHLELAKKLGADLTLRIEENPIQKIMEETKIGADVVIEATGTPESLDLALALVRNRGTINLKSTHGLKWMTNLTEIVVRELKLQGSRCGPFPPALKMLEDGTVHVTDLISATFPLSHIQDAIAAATKHETVKIIVLP